MKKMNVLITGIGGPTAQGVLRGLKEKEDVHIVGADRRSVTAGNLFCDNVYKIPRYTDTEAYKKAISDIVAKENIDAVFPCLHEEIEVYEEFKNELQAEVALPKSMIFNVLLNKEKTYQYLEEKGFSPYIPKYYGFNDTNELKEIIKENFQGKRFVVAKQVEGHGSLGFAILTDRQNYLQSVKEGKPRVINIEDYCDISYPKRRIAMDYLGGKEFSVDVFLHDGKVITAVPRERTGVSNGIVLDGMVICNEWLIQASTEIAECLAVNGFLNLQFIATEEGYKLTDINPRFCGSQVMSLGANVNFPYLFLQFNILKEKVAVTPRWNTRMLRYREVHFIYND